MNRKSFLKSIAALFGAPAVVKASKEPEPADVAPEQWRINPEWVNIKQCPACSGLLPYKTDFGTIRFLSGCCCRQIAENKRRMQQLKENHARHLQMQEAILKQQTGIPQRRKP